ncbi:cytochrome P450 [Penicillium malachiteum]|nr:cytochrome P450 [Penicillium malachiteum]
MMEVPFAKWVLPYIPLRSFREMFSCDGILLQHSRELVAYSRTHSGSCQNIFSGLVYKSEKDNVSLSDTDVAMEA